MSSSMSGLAQVDLRLEAARFLADTQPGFQVIQAPAQICHARMTTDVAEGLERRHNRSLPCTYLYDQVGSELYEQITALPEYYPTRCEAEIIANHAAELVSLTNMPQGAPTLVELGSGSSAKTRILLDAWDADCKPVTYIPIDVSQAILSDTVSTLSAQYPALRVMGLAGQYEDCLNLMAPGPHRLFLFLGGTIGNFTAGFQTLFFLNLAQRMGPGAQLLMGFDRRPHVHKPVEMIRRAYNDEAGVTAAFNLNMLTHINRALGADFNISNWRHIAIYNENAHQIEMYLESIKPQTVHIEALDKVYEFKREERILTEISRKFDPQLLIRWFARMGYRCLAEWTDAAELFGVILLET